jgi:hypothetical protein
MATEFDPTTNALLNTLSHFGVSDLELKADQDFICELMETVTESMSGGDDDMHIIRLMDCAYLGLLWHRHMPYEVDGELKRPEQVGPNDYVKTLAVVSASLHKDGVARHAIMAGATEGAMLARSHMKDPEDRDPEDEPLLRDILSLCSLGMVLHRLLPHHDQPPAGHVG